MTRFPLTFLALAAALAGCSAPPVPEAATEISAGPPPFVPDPLAARAYATPDPAYVPPPDPGELPCSAILGSASTGPLYTATGYGMDRWEEFIDSNPGVAPPSARGALELADFIVRFCRDTPVAVVRDPVNVFLSARPGSTVSRFGDTEVETTTPDAPDPILAGARVVPGQL